MAVSLNSFVGFNSPLQPKYHHLPRANIGVPVLKTAHLTSLSGLFGSRRAIKDQRWSSCLSVANSDRVATDINDKGAANAERSLSDDRLASDSSAGTVFESASESSEVSSETKQNTLSSPDVQSTQKRKSLTAREKLRAARVLSRYTETKASKAARGSTVLEALKERDRGKKRSGLPEAPTNLLDDSKRGMPKKGLTFDFPGGFDLFLIIFSFVFISTVMFATTYFVWKVGAIHFNEL